MFYGTSIEKQEYVKSQGPVADPKDIADIVVFLAGPQSRWINASTVNSNNGAVLF
jgi:3-oxoacyl-[acyl-carrier protein] reductase